MVDGSKLTSNFIKRFKVVENTQQLFFRQLSVENR